MPQNILSVYLSHAHSLHRLDQDYALSASSLSFGWNLRMIASTPKYGAIDPALALIEENLVDRTRTGGLGRCLQWRLRIRDRV